MEKSQENLCDLWDSTKLTNIKLIKVETIEDAVNELVKEGEMGAEEETQKTKGTKRKAESILAR